MATSGFGGDAPIKQEPGTQAEATNYVLDRQTAVQKTPISALQEMCTRKNIKPEYELLSTEGQVHEPTFMYRATVQDLSAVGQGKSKKTAKHLAAKGVLERIIAVGRFKDFGMGETAEEAQEMLRQLSDTTSGAGPSRLSGGDEPASGGAAPAMSSAVSVTSDEGAEGGPGNPVGRLQELCQRKKWPAPQYEMVREDGPPHERVFVIQVSLGKFTAEASGRSKKNAKREAAEKLFKIVDAIPPESQRENIGTAEEDELAETGGVEAIVQKPFAELDEHFSNLGFSDNVLTVRVADAEKSALKLLAKMDLEKETASAKHIELLEMIGADENWQPEYYPLPRRSTLGEYQCMVQLNTMPVAVCYGRGSTADDAKQAAAFNALEYLKVMTKEE